MAAFIAIEEASRRNLRRERVFRDRSDALDVLSDRELIERYRFPRQSILELTEMVRGDVERGTARSHAIPPHLQVMITLRHLAKGNFMSETGDLHGVSKASVSRCVDVVTQSINKNLDNVRFPEGQELVAVKESFYKVAQFPNCIGAIDGTLIPIVSPSQDEPAFICRKGFHALNVQAVANPDLRFTNLVCRWPGSVHDSFILSQSGLSTKLENKNYAGWLLGDSGYGLKPWLMTPILHPTTPQESAYNRAHAKTRVVIERAFGVLKSRFRCLHKTGGCLPFQPMKCTQVTECTFKLHNKCIIDQIPLIVEDLEEIEVNGNDNNIDDNPGNDAQAIRQRLVQRF